MSTTTTTRAPMSTTRKLALGAGLFYIATFVFSIPTLAMTDSFIHNPNFIHGAGSGTGVQWAALFDMLTGLTGIGTAVMVYPVIKRYGRTNAIGFVASRTLEAAILAVGAISLLTMYTLRHDLGGTAHRRPRRDRRCARRRAQVDLPVRSRGHGCPSTRCASPPCCAGPAWSPA